MSVLERQERYVELRCPVGPRALLAKISQENGGIPVQVKREFGVVQLSCRDCAKRLRRDDPSVKRVLHEYNVLGQLVESIIQRG